ncbi:sialate O-acetylesterase-like [Physella acuta]|uniref:sialate O-acetylesterase-like n=1 Tax=Physella acuta TaxID=109671 RepID=UPI0027DABE79|nr:sialate O-acetylesterase-like [Physella acuta]
MKPLVVLLLCLVTWSHHGTLGMDVFHMSQEVEKEFYKDQTTDLAAVTFSLAKHFQSHMVLQQAPQRANVYGFSPSIGQKVTLQLTTTPPTQTYNYETTVRQGPEPGLGQWNVLLDPFGPTTVATIRVTSEGVSLTIDDVLFGDVWICSGQSNMQMTVISIDVATEEMADAHNYPNIRLMTVNMDEAATPQYDLIKVEQSWIKADSSSIGHDAWTYFSAVCWLYGKAIFKAKNYPIGLVATDWGGTPVQAWSSPEALASCGIHDNPSIVQPDSYIKYLEQQPPEVRRRLEAPSEKSVLWNSMIHPLLGMTIYGAIWYQGESDAGPPAVNRYNCTFPAMIKDWRANFNRASNGQTSANFPFGFVQLAPNSPSPGPTSGFTDIRWHQTADRGYVPNPDLNNVFMAVAMDLPDFDSPSGAIHPRYKKDIGDRLAISGLAVAYNQGGLFQGPLPSGSSLTPAGLVIDYGTTWTLEIRVNSGFEVQCSHARWVATSITAHTQTTVTVNSANVCNTGEKITGIRYAWSESPCALHKCAVYETSKGLPAPPFVSYADYDQVGNPYFTFDRPQHI